MENPFRYGEIVTGEYFTDRDTELAELLADLRGGQNVVIISARRYGKTSLVLRAREQLTAAQTLVAYVDLLKTSTIEELTNELATALYNGIVAPLERVWKQALDLFRSLPTQPKLTLGQDGSWGVELTVPERTRDLEHLLDRLLELPQQIARARHRRAVLILDEFQQVVEIDPRLPARLRAVFQAQPDVAHLFLGSKQHLMRHVFTGDNQPLYRSAKPMPLGPIRPADFAAFIRERCRATGVIIDDAAIDQILAITAGHPHDTQELSHFAWGLAAAHGGPITADLVQAALTRVVAAEDARYTTLWESLTLTQRRLVTALAREPGRPIFSEAFRRRHRLGAGSSVQKTLARLLEREIVEGSSVHGYHVPDVFFQAWIGHTVR